MFRASVCMSKDGIQSQGTWSPNTYMRSAIIIIVLAVLGWLLWTAIDLASETKPQLEVDKFYIVTIASEGNPMVDRIVRVDTSVGFKAELCAAFKAAYELDGECMQGLAVTHYLGGCRHIHVAGEDDIWRCGLRTRLGL